MAEPGDTVLWAQHGSLAVPQQAGFSPAGHHSYLVSARTSCLCYYPLYSEQKRQTLFFTFHAYVKRELKISLTNRKPVSCSINGRKGQSKYTEKTSLLSCS